VKTAIVHFAGLSTDPDGDLCGLRPFWEGLADLIKATFKAVAWNDKDAWHIFGDLRTTHDRIYASGHSHGADVLYSILKRTEHNSVAIATFLDHAPVGFPTAWAGKAWHPPIGAAYTLSFFQRNDVPLCGVKMVADEIYDVTNWGLHHSDMCADHRVHDRIKDAVLFSHLKTQNKDKFLSKQE
jgi:hypothetical protein